MMSRKVPNQSFEVFIFAIGERRKILENKNKTQNSKGGKKNDSRYYAECREDGLHELGETLRHRGLFSWS